jgi:DNA repair protein RecO (recombination protein O)
MELIDNIVAIEDKNKDLFFLLLNFLEDLAKEKNDLDKLFCIFQIKTLDLSGFKPNIEDCVLCGKPIYIHGRFSTSFGGFICNHCIFKDASSKNVLKGTIASLRYIGNNNWENLRRFKLNAHINSEMKKLLHNFINFHVERKLKSREFVDMALV